MTTAGTLRPRLEGEHAETLRALAWLWGVDPVEATRRLVAQAAESSTGRRALAGYRRMLAEAERLRRETPADDPLASK